MRNNFGPFKFAFERSKPGVAPYLELLHLRESSTQHIDRIRKVALPPDSRAYVVAMLQDVNWRSHLVAIVASTVVQGLEQELWSTIDRASWVTPQIAAVLSIIDGRFAEEADSRLREGCRVRSRMRSDLDAPLNLVVLPKLAASLGALRGLDPNSVVEDTDQSAKIAVLWRDDLIRLLQPK